MIYKKNLVAGLFTLASGLSTQNALHVFPPVNNSAKSMQALLAFDQTGHCFKYLRMLKTCRNIRVLNCSDRLKCLDKYTLVSEVNFAWCQAPLNVGFYGKYRRWLGIF